MNNEETISRAEATRQVRQMGKMTASLYYHLCRQMIDAVGPEAAKGIVTKAIAALGEERGEAQKETVLAAGHEHLPQNYSKVSDLPSLGWDMEPVEQPENSTHIRITYCPFAEVWKEKDFAEFGRLYCYIDQAKYQGYHPDSDLVTLQNTLEGAPYCEMVCRTKKD